MGRVVKFLFKNDGTVVGDFEGLLAVKDAETFEKILGTIGEIEGRRIQPKTEKHEHVHTHEHERIHEEA